MNQNDKPILGLSEEVKIYLPNGKFIRRKAKIDTGARTTAIDITIAEKIGMIHVYNEFHERMKDVKLNHDNFQEFKKQLKEEYLPELRKAIPDLHDAKVIPATNGVTLRPYIKFSYKLMEKRIDTVVNIVDRGFLLYPVLVGKVDMDGFMIDPTKNVYKNV